MDQRYPCGRPRIYAAAGFRLVEGTPHADFGPPTVGENWVLDLQ